MNITDTLQKIEAAFNGVARSETSLRQFRLTDKKGMSGKITKEEWNEAGRTRVDGRWQEVPDSEILECDCVLAHMQAEEFRYFLPAYMRYSLRNLTSEYHENLICGMTIFSLTLSKRGDLRAYVLKQWSLLDNRQKVGIRGFLEFVSSCDDAILASDANEAMQSWLED